jgi:hypothetical protein
MTALSVLSCLVGGGVLHAQTPEIQEHVTTLLWWHWFRERLRALAEPTSCLLLLLIAVGLVLYGASWLWKSRRPARGEIAPGQGQPPAIAD